MRAEDIYGKDYNKWIDPCTVDIDNNSSSNHIDNSDNEDELIDEILNDKNKDEDEDSN